jgi:hypothetical protein
VGTDGRFGFVSADLPLRRDWGFEDVARVEVALPTHAGHQIVVGSPGGAVDHLGPRTVFLPRAMR